MKKIFEKIKSLFGLLLLAFAVFKFVVKYKNTSDVDRLAHLVNRRLIDEIWIEFGKKSIWKIKLS